MGPWARSFLHAVAGNADRPELEVHGLTIEPRTIRAQADDCEVTLTAVVVPPRMWTAMVRYAQGMGQLEDAVKGKVQSVHLEHLLEEDWGEPLIPRPRSIARTCTCDEGGGTCDHVVAVAYAVAEAIEAAPKLLLEWRGVAGDREPAGAVSADPWQGGEVTTRAEPRTMPTNAVLKRLGPSGTSAGGSNDLAAALRIAYESLTSGS
jgi:hypothetical protein